MAQEKFVMERLKRSARAPKREYPHIRISMSAYAHVAEIADETGRSLCDVASQAIDYAHSNLVYADRSNGVVTNPRTGTETELWKFERVDNDPETLAEVEAILGRVGISRYELARLLTSLRVRPEFNLDDFRE